MPCTLLWSQRVYLRPTNFNEYELEAEDFRFDPTYPDVKTERNEEFALIEILWSVGRSVKSKKKFLEELMNTLAHAGIDTENVMVCFKETSWENWAFAGGRLIHT